MQAIMPKVGEIVIVGKIRYRVTQVVHELTVDEYELGTFKNNPVVECGERL